MNVSINWDLSRLTKPSVIFQDPLLLGISLRENLALRFLGTPNIPGDSEMWWALKRIGLADWVERQDRKLDTLLDGDVHLSRGEVSIFAFDAELHS